MAPSSGQVSTSHTDAHLSTFCICLVSSTPSISPSVHSKFGQLHLHPSPKANPPPPLACPLSLLLPWHLIVLSRGAGEMGHCQYHAYSLSVLSDTWEHSSPESFSPTLSSFLSSGLHHLVWVLSVSWRPQACPFPWLHFLFPLPINTLPHTFPLLISQVPDHCHFLRKTLLDHPS